MQHHERRNLSRYEYRLFNQLSDLQKKQKDALGWPEPKKRIPVTLGMIGGTVAGWSIGIALVGLIIFMIKLMIHG